MSTTSMPGLALVSEDWDLAEDGHRPASLLVQLRRSMYVLPWFRFVYAEGNDSKAQLDFGEHTVTVTGSGLEALLEAVSSHRLIRLIQPTQNEAKFNVRGPDSVKQMGRPVIANIIMDDQEVQ